MIVIDALKAGGVPEVVPEKARKIPGEILEAIQSGDQVKAIRSYRLIYDVSLARAKYAIEQIQSGNLEDPETGFPKNVSPYTKIQPDPFDNTTQTLKRTQVPGWIIPTFILLVVGVLLTILFKQPGSPLVPILVAMSPAILLEDNEGGKVDILSQFYNVNSELRLVGRVDSKKSRLAWQSDPLPKDTYVDALQTNEELVFYASEDQLYAIKQADGSPEWQAQMPDKLNYGEQSMDVTGERLLVLTLDRSLNAYDTTTGKRVWKRVLNGYERTIRLMGNHVVVVDYPEGSTNFSLFVLNTTDGSLIHVISPVCQQGESMEDDINPDSGITYDAETGKLFLIYGSFNGCIQRYDLESGVLDWQYFQKEAFSLSMQGFNPLVTQATMFFADEHGLYAVDKREGTVRILLEDPDYELVPLKLFGENLLVRARRTRGSERFELWGLNAGTGTRLWKIVLEKSSPIDPPNEMIGLIDSGEQGWSWHALDDDFLLLGFKAEPNQLVIAKVNTADGNRSNELTIPLKGVSGDFYSVPEIIGWREGLLYLSLDSDLYILDTSSGKILMRFQ
jgi:outer membrane protein assembly factor BamB